MAEPISNYQPPIEPQIAPPVTTPPPAPRKTSLIPLLVSILVVVLFGTTAFFAYQYFSPKTKTQSSTIVLPSSSPKSQTDETANWKIYINTHYNYSFKYPDAYDVGINGSTGPNSSVVSTEALSAYIPNYKEPLEGASFSVTVIDNPKGLSLENLASQHVQKILKKVPETDMANAIKTFKVPMQNNQLTSNGIIKTTFNGLISHEYTVRGSSIDDGASERIVPTRGHRYIWVQSGKNTFLIYATLDPIVDKMLSTFSFTNKQETISSSKRAYEITIRSESGEKLSSIMERNNNSMFLVGYLAQLFNCKNDAFLYSTVDTTQTSTAEDSDYKKTVQIVLAADQSVLQETYSNFEVKVQVTRLPDNQIAYIANPKYCEVDTDCMIRTNFCEHGGYNKYHGYADVWGCGPPNYETSPNEYKSSIDFDIEQDGKPCGEPVASYENATCVNNKCQANGFVACPNRGK